MKGKLESFEQNRKERFEPAIAFVKEAKEATCFLAEKNSAKNRDFRRKIGSNLPLSEKTLSVQFKNPWKILSGFNFDNTPPLAHQHEISSKQNWRRERDSNPRKDYSFTGLANLRFRPLSHLSNPCSQVCLKPEKDTDSGEDFIRATVQGKPIRESFSIATRAQLGQGSPAR